MNDIDKAGIVYLCKRGIGKDVVAKAYNVTKRDVEETVRQARKGAWDGYRWTRGR